MASMAQAMASMAGLRGSSQAVLLRGSSRLCGAGAIKVALANPGFGVKANLQPETDITSRRAALGLVAAGIASGSFVQAVLAQDDKPCEALDRAKKSAKDMVNMIKSFTDRKNWDDLATYLHGNASLLSHLNTAISGVPKEKRILLKELTGKLSTSIHNLKKAAHSKNPQAKNFSDETVSELRAVISFPCSA